MSVAGITPPRAPPSIERRWSRRPGGIEIQTWRLIETRMLPEEAEHLPLAVLFDDDGAQGSVPAALLDEADTLETPPGDQIARADPAATGGGDAPADRDEQTERS